MAFWSGLGGSVIVDPTGTPKTIVAHSHTVRKTSKNTENTHTGSVASNFEHLYPHYEATIKVPWDDTNLPDVDVGLQEGAKVNIKFPDGNSTKFLILSGTLVESLEEELDVMSNIILAVITTKGGTLTRQVT